MEWQDKPTKEGYYWLYKKGNKKVGKQSLFVLMKHDGELMASDGAFMWHLWEYKGAMWYGPLQPPTAPQAEPDCAHHETFEEDGYKLCMICGERLHEVTR